MDDIKINFEKFIRKDDKENGKFIIPIEHTLPVEYIPATSCVNCITPQSQHNDFTHMKSYYDSGYCLTDVNKLLSPYGITCELRFNYG